MRRQHLIGLEFKTKKDKCPATTNASAEAEGGATGGQRSRGVLFVSDQLEASNVVCCSGMKEGLELGAELPKGVFFL